MQDYDGSLRIENSKKFQNQIKQMFNTMPESDIPVVKVGDVFKVRDCHFEITEISKEGIVAKGIRRGEFINKKFKC